MKLSSILVAGMLSCAAATAHAGAITYNGTFSGATDVTDHLIGVSQFNPSLGELQSVTVALGAVMSTSASVANDGDFLFGWDKRLYSLSLAAPDILFGALKIDASLPATRLVGSGVSPTDLNESILPGDRAHVISGSNPHGFSGPTLSATRSFTENILVDDFKGIGTLGFYLTTVNWDVYSAAGQGVPGNALSLSTNVVANVEVTYVYAASPVPEPTSYAMLLAGLAAVMMRAQRRQRRAA